METRFNLQGFIHERLHPNRFEVESELSYLVAEQRKIKAKPARPRAQQPGPLYHVAGLHNPRTAEQLADHYHGRVAAGPGRDSTVQRDQEDLQCREGHADGEETRKKSIHNEAAARAKRRPAGHRRWPRGRGAARSG